MRKKLQKAVYDAKGPSKTSRLIPDALKNWYWWLTAYVLLIVGEIEMTTPGTLRSHYQIWGITLRVGMRVRAGRITFWKSCRPLWGCESCSNGIWRDFTGPRIKVYSSQETMLQGIAAVLARWSGKGSDNLQLTKAWWVISKVHEKVRSCSKQKPDQEHSSIGEYMDRTMGKLIECRIHRQTLQPINVKAKVMHELAHL